MQLVKKPPKTKQTFKDFFYISTPSEEYFF